MRAIQIIRAAQAGDLTTLNDLVAPAANFHLWRGDYTTSARSKGVSGIIEFARDMNAHRFEVSIERVGPVVIEAGWCHQEATILFDTAQETEGVTAKFSFKDGVLIGAEGKAVDLLRDDISQY